MKKNLVLAAAGVVIFAMTACTEADPPQTVSPPPPAPVETDGGETNPGESDTMTGLAAPTEGLRLYDAAAEAFKQQETITVTARQTVSYGTAVNGMDVLDITKSPETFTVNRTSGYLGGESPIETPTETTFADGKLTTTTPAGDSESETTYDEAWATLTFPESLGATPVWISGNGVSNETIEDANGTTVISFDLSADELNRMYSNEIAEFLNVQDNDNFDFTLVGGNAEIQIDADGNLSLVVIKFTIDGEPKEEGAEPTTITFETTTTYAVQ